MTQLGMFDGTGLTTSDRQRLSTHLERVYRVMSRSGWLTLGELATQAGCSEAGASARLRDLRKEKFLALYPNAGIEKRRVSGGLYQYRMRRAQ